MNRRAFTTLLGGAAVVWPIAARAQQAGKVHRIGMLETISTTLNVANFYALREGLRQLDTRRGKTSSSNIDRPTVATTVFRDWRASFLL